MESVKKKNMHSIPNNQTTVISVSDKREEAECITGSKYKKLTRQETDKYLWTIVQPLRIHTCTLKMESNIENNSGESYCEKKLQKHESWVYLTRSKINDWNVG